MASGFQLVVLLCLTSGLWMEANAWKCSGSPAKCCPCTDGWTLFGSRCFQFIFEEKAWAGAEVSCTGLGGNLASIQKDREYKFLRELVKKSTGKDKPTWLGGHDSAKEKSWYWTDGGDFNFKNWAIGEPNNSGGNEDCMEMNFQERDFVNDCNCDQKKSFICAKKI